MTGWGGGGGGTTPIFCAGCFSQDCQANILSKLHTGKLSKLGKIGMLSKLGNLGMLVFDKKIFIFISISSCLHQHYVDTEWKILTGVGNKPPYINLPARPAIS